jgi:hypothetical protein
MRLKLYVAMLLTATILSIASMAGTIRQSRKDHPSWTYFDRGSAEAKATETFKQWWPRKALR